jgi:hypothetical protein
VHELAVEVAADVVVDVALLLLHLPRLVPEHCVLVPTLGQRVGGVDQRIPLQQLRLPVRQRLLVLLFSLVQFFLLPLLLDALVFPQQLLAFVVVIVLGLRLHPLLLLLLALLPHELLRVGVFWEGVVLQIDQFLAVKFDLLPDFGLVSSDEVHIARIDGSVTAVSNLPVFRYVDLSVFLSLRLRFTLQKFRSEIFLAQLFEGALPDFTFFKFEVTGEVLHGGEGTRAE